MLQYSRIKEQDKEMGCLGPGWPSSSLVPFSGGGTDSVLVGVTAWQAEFSEQGQAHSPALCFEIQTIRTEVVPRTFLAQSVVDKSSR